MTSTNEPTEAAPAAQTGEASAIQGDGSTDGDEYIVDLEHIKKQALEEMSFLLNKFAVTTETVQKRATELRAKGFLKAETDEASHDTHKLSISNNPPQGAKDRLADLFDEVQTMKSKGFKAYIRIGDTKFSYPGPADVGVMSTGKDALSHTVKFLCPKDDYKCLQISHHVPGLQTTILKNKCVGHTDVWSMDIDELTCELLDNTTALKEVRRFNAAASKAPPFTFRITVKSDSASSSIKHVAYRAVRNVNRALEQQLKDLHQAISNKQCIEMLIGTHNDEDAHRLVQMCLASETHRCKDRFFDPLAKFFIHAPRAKTIFASQVKKSAERLDPMPGVTKWANKHQHLVHHVYGSVYDAIEEVNATLNVTIILLQSICAADVERVNDESFCWWSTQESSCVSAKSWRTLPNHDLMPLHSRRSCPKKSVKRTTRLLSMKSWKFSSLPSGPKIARPKSFRVSPSWLTSVERSRTSCG